MKLLARPRHCAFLIVNKYVRIIERFECSVVSDRELEQEKRRKPSACISSPAVRLGHRTETISDFETGILLVDTTCDGSSFVGKQETDKAFC
jgi:hypothetical protein